MMQLQSVVTLFADLDAAELSGWIARSWVRPEQQGDAFVFQDIDVARVHLIYDLRRSMAVPEETVPLVLSLLDQVHALRGAMSVIAGALETQPAAVREAVRSALGRSHG